MSRPIIPGGAFGSGISRLVRPSAKAAPKAAPKAAINAAAIWASDWTPAAPQQQVIAVGSPVSYWVANTPRQAWSVSSSDDETIRVEIHPGDLYTSAGWTDSSTTERNELYYADITSPNEDKAWQIPNGTACALEVDITKRDANIYTAPWMVLAQVFGNGAGGSPPIELSLASNDNKFGIVLRNNAVESSPWVMSSPWAQNATHRLRMEWTLNGNQTGTVRVWWDGVQVVNFSGTVGHTGQTSQEFSIGTYRFESTEATAFDFEVIGVQIGSHSTF